MTTAYIYLLRDPHTQQPRYIGKSIDPQKRFGDHCRDKGHTRKAHWIQALRAEGLQPVLEILGAVDDAEWEQAEHDWIVSFRDIGCELFNHTDGGEGLHNPSAETRAKMGQIQKARMADPQYREKLFTPERSAKISKALTGRKKSAEHVAKLPQNRPGRKLSEAHKQKLRANTRGHRWTSEEVKQLRAQGKYGHVFAPGNKSRIGYINSAEMNRKISATTKGRCKSELHKERIRQGQRRAWARRKAQLQEGKQ